jgi:hypothetical protein
LALIGEQRETTIIQRTATHVQDTLVIGVDTPGLHASSINISGLTFNRTLTFNMMRDDGGDCGCNGARRESCPTCLAAAVCGGLHHAGPPPGRGRGGRGGRGGGGVGHGEVV